MWMYLIIKCSGDNGERMIIREGIEGGNYAVGREGRE